jgi:hypothetical protein
VATDVKKGEEEEGGEFADFMADISQEIAQRVESLDPSQKAKPEEKKIPTPVPDAGIIREWVSIVDRMIEEMR